MGFIGVELVEEVVAALPVDCAVDVVHPGGGRQEVIRRPLPVGEQPLAQVARSAQQYLGLLDLSRVRRRLGHRHPSPANRGRTPE
jgi:hypothetical protein